MRTFVVLFATVYLLRGLVAEANHALSGVHTWLFAGGLFVTYSALMVPFREGFIVSVLAGLLCDSAAPVGFGTHAVLFGAAHAVVFNLRERLQRDETPVRVAVALFVNLGLYLALSFARLRHAPGATLWPRIAWDLTWSEAVLALAAPWFFALQVRSLQMARAIPWRSA